VVHIKNKVKIDGQAELKKVQRFLAEFKEFAVRGNMIDLAVGIIVGGAFSGLVSSLVSNIATPLLGILIGVDFKEWKIELPKLYGNAEPSILEVGIFLNGVISFLIVAFTVFLFVKAINKFRKKQEPPPPEPSQEQLLLAEIRDILKQRAGVQAELQATNQAAMQEDLQTEQQAEK
jgi:large conductance mechanosensitive channel